MNIRIREQAGTDAVRKFDYQMAVALDYLLSEMDNDAIILIETLEDFAVFHNHGSKNETVDIYQVKTKDKGLYEKNAMYKDNVLGKIILTDYYFDSASETLNIVCNTALKGTSTEEFEIFQFESTLSTNELAKLKANVVQYLQGEPEFKGTVDTYWGKLIYIKSPLPFSGKEDRYSETLVGKTNNAIAKHLGDENHSINPQAIFTTLKLLIDKRRRDRISQPNIDVEEAIERKGIRSSEVKNIIDQAVALHYLSKTEILQHAAQIFAPDDYLEIKDEFPTFLSYRANLADQAFLEAKKTIQEEYYSLTRKGIGTLDDIVRCTAANCIEKVPFYSRAIIQIITIVVVFS